MKHLIQLSDGRAIEVLEQGDSAGWPIIYLNGAPGSCHERNEFEEDYKRLGLRLISVNRPGTGASSSCVGWDALSFADDLRQVLDQLDVDTVKVIGFSVGGLYGCAFAHSYPERVERLVLLSSAAPLDNAFLYEKLPEAYRPFYEGARHDPEGLLQQFSGITSPVALFSFVESILFPVDKKTVALPQVREALLAAYTDVLQQGMGSFVKEASNMASPWGFSPAEIRVDTHIWCGTADQSTPVEFSEYLAEVIPATTATFVEGAGHYFSFEQWPALLQATAAKDG